jgi:soluble lytic murein transglycosylase-like protein
VPLFLPLLVLVLAAAPAVLAQQIYLQFDDDGTPVFSDRPSALAAPYQLGSFEEVALRQQNQPHVGLGTALVPSRRGADLVVPGDVDALLREMARKHGVPFQLLRAVAAVESGFRKDAVSPAGARGLMQLMPATARDLGVDPDKPRENVEGGARYLAFLLKHFGEVPLALAAYNAGPGRVKRAGNVVPEIPETKRYVQSVMSLAGY